MTKESEDRIIRDADNWHETVNKVSFSRIPNAIFEYAGVFDLSPSELGFLCTLLHHMRYKKGRKRPSKIYPSLTRLANYKVKASRKTLYNLAVGLRDKGLLKIIERNGDTNYYDLSRLFAILFSLVQVDLTIKEEIAIEYEEGSIKDRKEADERRFNQLKKHFEARKKELGITRGPV